MIEEKCSNCRYWKKESDWRGVCMRYPPQLLPVTVLGSSVSLNNRYPSAKDDDWCGEYKSWTIASE